MFIILCMITTRSGGSIANNSSRTRQYFVVTLFGCSVGGWKLTDGVKQEKRFWVFVFILLSRSKKMINEATSKNKWQRTRLKSKANNFTHSFSSEDLDLIQHLRLRFCFLPTHRPLFLIYINHRFNCPPSHPTRGLFLSWEEGGCLY